MFLFFGRRNPRSGFALDCRLRRIAIDSRGEVATRTASAPASAARIAILAIFPTKIEFGNVGLDVGVIDFAIGDAGQLGRNGANVAADFSHDGQTGVGRLRSVRVNS